MIALKYDITNEVEARLIVHDFLASQDKLANIQIVTSNGMVTYTKEVRSRLSPIPPKQGQWFKTTRTVWTLTSQDVYNVAAALESKKYDETKMWQKFDTKFRVS